MFLTEKYLQLTAKLVLKNVVKTSLRKRQISNPKKFELVIDFKRLLQKRKHYDKLNYEST